MRKIKKINFLKLQILGTLLLAMNFQSHAKSPSFKTYMNPVIPGDHPDCTLTRVGNDFYTTGSSFNVTPVIYHSTDLVHWEAIAQPVSAAWSGYGDSPGGGCWGGHMVYYNGEYWHFFSRANTMYYVKAKDPKGPWSMPARINNPSNLPYTLGYDNSIFIDEDNSWYLLVKNGKPNNGIVQLNAQGQPTGLVYDLKWLNPDPTYPYSWAEGPVMWKYGGFYYYSFARDLAGGQKVMRSQILTDQQSAWEILGDLFNENDPLKNTSLFTSPNHASPVIALDDSTFWLMHPLYAKGEWKGQGRQGLLNQVRYDANGKPTADYPVNKSFPAPNLPSSGIPWMVPKSDFFNSPTLHPEWSFLGYTPNSTWSLTERPGWLKLVPKSRSKGNTILKNDGEHNYSLITRIDFSPESNSDEAGLWIMRGDEASFVKLVGTISNSGEKVIAFYFDTSRCEMKNEIGDTIWLKIVRINHRISGYFSKDGIIWQQLGKTFNIMTIDSYSDFTTFTGTRQGLYVRGSKPAWFDFYIYRDAFTPILAECPANQYGTSLSRRTDGIASLDQIHNDDWALYAGVEFGNNEYTRVADSVVFVASTPYSGGVIEVWLDSIDTGTKIAECPITSTGSWSDYKNFSAPLLQKVTGNHDVYLKFVGSDGDKLFMLKWLYFVEKSKGTTSTLSPNPSNSPSKMKLYQNYPNPFNCQTTISFDLPVASRVKLKIFDVSGRELATLLDKRCEAGQISYNFNAQDLPAGIYIYQLETDQSKQVRKMLLVK